MAIPVIYWSGTGNTEAMAKAVAEGIKANGKEAKLLAVGDASAADVEAAEAVALGCPAMGDEILEEDEMEPFVESIADAVKGKKVVLFGSYDWGDGQWMRDWQERMKGYGADVVKEGLIANLEPDDDALAACKELGKAL
ncbi:flavodoxin [Lachnospiraceae bacterium oral taxon 500]|nr:flavodoxin [Lachnospiraceae bacterium oral taxon 500]